MPKTEEILINFNILAQISRKFHAIFLTKYWNSVALGNPVNGTGHYWWYVNIGSGYGLMPPDIKSLPEPMLIQISIDIWYHKATMS